MKTVVPAWTKSKSTAKRTGGVAQVIEHRPSKCQTISSNPHAAKKEVKQTRKTYLPIFSGRDCSEMSFTERHVKFCNSGKLSGNLGPKNVVNLNSVYEAYTK
jgi:hypothetical protein